MHTEIYEGYIDIVSVGRSICFCSLFLFFLDGPSQIILQNKFSLATRFKKTL